MKRYVFSLFFAAALVSGLSLYSVNPVFSQNKGKNIDPHTPVSSDGSVILKAEFSSYLKGEYPFEGTSVELAPGETADHLAEFSQEMESAEDVWKLWKLKPAAGKEGRETIIGTDNRVRVNPTTTYPARAVALITFDVPGGGSGRCTGWLYGPDVVATAGHCVHTGGPGGTFYTNVRVYPGRNGSTSPYGSCTAKRLHTVTGWTNSSDERYDYGAIKLSCSIGNTTGWFGYFWQSATLTGQASIINGYPGDKPLTQWKSTDQIRVTQTRQLFYSNDTIGGMSGGPVYNDRPAGSSFCVGVCSMAIHAYGVHGSSPHNTYNHGTRIVDTVFNNLKAWKDAP